MNILIFSIPQIAKQRQLIFPDNIIEGVELVIDDYLNFRKPVGAAGIIQLSIETRKNSKLEATFADVRYQRACIFDMLLTVACRQLNAEYIS